jgi:hypothetical protein
LKDDLALGRKRIDEKICAPEASDRRRFEAAQDGILDYVKGKKKVKRTC